MADEFTRRILQVSISQQGLAVGWNAVQSSSLDILTDIFERYMRLLCLNVNNEANLANRTRVNLDDVVMAFRELDISFLELEDHAKNFGNIPSIYSDMPNYPVPVPGLNRAYYWDGVGPKDGPIENYLPPIPYEALAAAKEQAVYSMGCNSDSMPNPSGTLPSLSVGEYALLTQDFSHQPIPSSSVTNFASGVDDQSEQPEAGTSSSAVITFEDFAADVGQETPICISAATPKRGKRKRKTSDAAQGDAGPSLELPVVTEDAVVRPTVDVMPNVQFETPCRVDPPRRGRPSKKIKLLLPALEESLANTTPVLPALETVELKPLPPSTTRSGSLKVLLKAAVPTGADVLTGSSVIPSSSASMTAATPAVANLREGTFAPPPVDEDISAPAGSSSSTAVFAAQSEVYYCPSCLQPDDGSTMICCDKCERWFHLPCVGLTEVPDDNVKWFCRGCIVQRGRRGRGAKR